MFRDRREAGRLLAGRLSRLEPEDPLVAGLPRGGVPVAYEIAVALAAPLDVIVVRKLGAPRQPELAVGSVAFGLREPIIFQDLVRRLSVPESHLRAEIAQARAESLRQNSLFRAGRPAPAVAGRTVIVVDDGLATGMSMRAGLEAMRRLRASRLVAAVPVAAPESVSELRAFCDEVVCLSSPQGFASVGAHYADFSATPDEEVVSLLADAAARFSPRP